MERFRLMTAMAVVLACSCSLIGVSTAAASDATVRAAIKQAGKQVKESPELKTAVKDIRSGKGKLSASKTEALFTKFAAALERATRTVEAQKASTSKGKQGESLWLAGTRMATTGFRDFAKAVEESKAGQKSEARREALKAAGTIVKSAKDLNRSDELLSVK